jgi:hypothetical protein
MIEARAIDSSDGQEHPRGTGALRLPLAIQLIGWVLSARRADLGSIVVR